MANHSSPPPSGNPPSGKPPQGGDVGGAATVMLEAPSLPAAPAAAPIAEQKTAILDTGSPQMASVQAQIAEARARAGGGPPAPAPIAEMKTAILDAGSPQMASVQAQIAEARARAGSPPPAAAPISDQKTAILEAGSPQMASLQAQIADARARGQAPPPGAARNPPLGEQKTAILDTSSPDMAAYKAQIADARARPQGAPPPAAAPGGEQRTAILDAAALGPHPTSQVAGGRAPMGAAGPAQRTMSLDVSAAAGGKRPSGPQAPPQRLQPLDQRRPPSTWARWVIGPAISLATAAVTFGAAGALMPRRPVIVTPPPPPPPPVVMGKIRLETNPPGANVTLNGKPHPKFTPTDIEGPVGEAPTHLVVQIPGWKTQEQDVLFTTIAQKLTLNLEKKDDGATRSPARKPGSGSSGSSGTSGSHSRAAPAEGGDRITLVEDKGSLEIRVEATNITVDGQSVGKGPIRALTLKPGPHTIELVNDRRAKRERLVVDVKPGENPPIVRGW